MKTKQLLLGIFCAVAMGCVCMFSSCSNESENCKISEEELAINHYHDEFNAAVTHFMKGNLKEHLGSRGEIEPDTLPPDSILIQIPIPDPGTDIPFDPFPVNPDSINDFQDIYNLVLTTGARLRLISAQNPDGSFTGTGEYTHEDEWGSGSQNITLAITDEQANDALAELIESSKNFLYSRGLTEGDIRRMLQENNQTESALVPFVMAIVQCEEEYKNINQASILNFGSIFGLYAQADIDIDWVKVGNCAISAIGADIFYSLSQVGIAHWTKKAILKIFGIVAKRFLGPVGVCIAILEFSRCMGDWW